MIPLIRNKRKIYVCNAYLENELKRFREPIKLYVNCQTTHGNADLTSFGMEAYQYMRIKTTSQYAKYFHLGDAIYVNVEPPEEHDILCKKADYEVSEDPIVTFNHVEILLKRRSGRR